MSSFAKKIYVQCVLYILLLKVLRVLRVFLMTKFHQIKETIELTRSQKCTV